MRAYAAVITGVACALSACAVEEVPGVEEAPVAPSPRRVRPKALPPVPGLAKAEAKPCLAGPSGEGLADEGMVASVGLSEAQVREVMGAFVQNTLACVPEGTAPNGTVSTEVTVACTGLVSDVRVLDGGGLPEDVVKCVQQTLTYAAFPAHDLPDGYSFGYPVTFRF